MSEFTRITPEELAGNPFQSIGKQWMLVTGEREGKANTMTASWGGMGVLWNKNVAFVFIRPQRFTKEFVDAGECFSLSFLPERYRKELGYLGSVSGRDEDKISTTGLTLCNGEAAPYFAEAETVLLCRKLYAQELRSECFLDPEPDAKCYPQKDYHTMYVAEITEILTK